VDLRTGLSFWRAADPPITDEFSPLAGDVACEVAVVGGGITGALVGYALTKAGVRAVLVDKRELGTGSTAASTGLLLYEIDVPLVELIGKVGEQAAVHAYRRGLRAIDEFEQLAGELREPCGFSRRPSLYFASSPADVDAVHREYLCRREHGFNVELLDATALRDRSSIAAGAAIYSLDDAQVDPYRLTARLLHRAHEMGLQVFPKTHVQKVRHREHKESVTLETHSGRITAGAVVLAGGYESVDWVPNELSQLHSTYVVTSEPLSSFEGWPDRCLIWETARPYFYARQTEDGRAMIGGEDTPVAEDHQDPALLATKVMRLQARFHQLFPRLEFEPAYAWAGTFADTQDGLAYIGTPPGRDREYFALGYGGNGITYGLIAARLITDLVLGRPNEDAAVFRFGR
jgi:glycine/D-amino acid oxidase-like deaminating enzyme